ncbi:hypothetical protein [Streptomyces sp. NPDC001091]
MNGWLCAHHTPAAMRGQPETPPGPGWPIHRELPIDHSTTDPEPTDPEPTEQEDPTP